MKAALRAGEVVEARLQAGNEPTARQVMGLFVNAIHAYYENAAGEPAWVVWTAEMKQPLVATNQFSKLETVNGFAFVGQPTEGPLAGSRITGAVIQGADRQLYVVTQVENQAVKVVFAQPLQQLDLSGSADGSN